MFVSLHNHSDYSRFDSINKIKKMLIRTQELGQDALGLCDHGTTSGLLDFYIQATKSGIKPILGCEFYISTNINVKERSDIYHLCLFAKDFEGYKNINRLNSFAHNHIYYEPRISFEQLRKYSNSLVCTSACMGGILKRDDAQEWARVLKEIFGCDFYLEMQFNLLPEQREYNQKVMGIAEKLDIPYICAVDSHYTYKEDAEIHRAWKNIKEGSNYYTTDDYYMFSEKEMIEHMAAHGWYEGVIYTALANTREIANKCNCQIPTEKLNYPVFPVENQKERILELTREGVRRKLALPLSEEYIERIKLELNMLEKASYLNYFLIIHDLVKWCDNVSKIRRGAGRGSVVASIIAYLLDITGLDPLKYGLLFERFLHLERVTPCDIDTDFESARRDEVIQYLKDKYGYAYQVRTFNLVGARAGIQRAGQSMGLEPMEIDRISTSIPKDGTLDNLPKKYDGRILTQEQYDRLLYLASAFQGIIQSYGIHASAVMVFPKEVENWCSIECQDNNYIVNYDFHLLEEHCGLLKLDILGLKTMDVIQETLSQLTDEQIFFDINNLPDTDEKTAQMLCQGETKGCFQIEGDGMTKLVIDLQPKEFRDLIPLVALYRPGCLKAGMVGDFVKRRRGEESVEYILPQFEPIMCDTYGVMLYQEQVMQMVQVMANYSLGQADMFRRAIGRKDEKLMKEIIPPFIKACQENGFTKEQAQKVADYINGCSDYLFNMGHSAGYGYIAYQTAFLKAHFPVQFLCALLNVYLDDKEAQTEYIEDARKLGINVLPPNISESKTKWSVTKEGFLRVGFGAIRNVGNFSVPTDESEFHSFMRKYYKINKKVLEFLVKAGCFEEDRALQLPQIDWYKCDKKGYKRIVECREKIEFAHEKGSEKKIAEWTEKLNRVPPISSIKSVQPRIAEWEMEALGFTFNEILDQYDLSLAEKLQNIVGGELIEVKPWLTKKGEPMAFVKLRDKDKIHDLVIFDERYKEFKINGVYLFKLYKTVIKDIALAKLKLPA